MASKTESAVHFYSLHSDGKTLGAEIHAILEQISWLDEMQITIPNTPAGAIVSKLLLNPQLKVIFYRNGRNVEVFREQAAESMPSNNFLTGIIDRLHLYRDHDGFVTKVEIFDYKLDRETDFDHLISRYYSQMHAYKTTIGQIFPTAEVECAMISVIEGILIPI